GTVVDLWLSQASLAERSARSLADTGEGTALVAARVRHDGALWRYDYALANFDLTRTATSGSEPNLSILAQDAVGGVVVLPANGAAITAAGFADGDADAGNDWPGSSGGEAAWSAPDASAQLAWGQLMTFTATSAHPP